MVPSDEGMRLASRTDSGVGLAIETARSVSARIARDPTGFELQ